MYRFHSPEFHQIENQVIEVVRVVYIQVNGAVKYAVMAMQIDGSHADIQFLCNGVGNGIVYSEAVPSVQLDPGQVGEDFVLGPFGGHQFVTLTGHNLYSCTAVGPVNQNSAVFLTHGDHLISWYGATAIGQVISTLFIAHTLPENQGPPGVVFCLIIYFFL